jgi:hypothetical protein
MVAKELQAGSSHERTLAQIVETLADASDSLRDNTLDDTIQAADSFARRNPLVFFGAAALAGFAATRLVKATTSTDAPESDHEPQTGDDAND